MDLQNLGIALIWFLGGSVVAWWYLRRERQRKRLSGWKVGLVVVLWLAICVEGTWALLTGTFLLDEIVLRLID